jgi:rubrerythrin
MGVSCSSEVFQRKNVEMFGNIQNIRIIHDDIIIAAADEAEHDAALRELLVRAHRFNVRFNKDKLWLKQPSIKYFGNVLSSQVWQADEDKVRAIKSMPEPKDKKSEWVTGPIFWTRPDPTR